MCEKHSLKANPRVVLVSFEEDEKLQFKSFVVLSRMYKYEFLNVTEAVDVCFKILNVMPGEKKNYGHIAHYMWQFLEIYVYNLPSRGSPLIAVSNLIAALC